ncbi:hypothetical protein [Roseovarius sp. D22-M7]|uniref:hypothetical protein n=1 Tax=Roseovarius sp. D22-M7 TaxID=3127116 RepID=UPI00300F9641
MNAGIQAARTRLDAKDAPDGRVELRRTALGTVEIMLTGIESAPTVAGTTMMRPCCRGCPAASIVPARGTSTRRSTCHISSRTWRAMILVQSNSPRFTLRMLFGFVGLQPTEILELGRDNREDAERRLAREKVQRGGVERIGHRGTVSSTDLTRS